MKYRYAGSHISNGHMHVLIFNLLFYFNTSFMKGENSKCASLTACQSMSLQGFVVMLSRICSC